MFTRCKSSPWWHSHAPFKTLGWALLGLALVATSEAISEYYARRNARETERATVLTQLAALRANLEHLIYANFYRAKGLRAVIAARPDLDQATFAQVAGQLVDGHILRNIAAAPDMVIRLMYPLENNEAAIGLDYRRVPEQREAAERARDSGQTVVAGPLPLRQGGIGVIVREPVFLRDDASGEQRFWGLIAAVMDAEALYRLAGLYDAAAKLRLALRGTDGHGAEGEVFFGDASVFASAAEAITLTVPIPGGSWQLAATPQGGWGKTAPIGALRLLGLMSGLAVTWLLVWLVSTRHTLALRNAQLKALFDHSPDLIWLKDCQGVYLACNKRFEDFFGAPEADIVGKTDYDFVAPEQAQAFRADDAKAIAQDRPYCVEEYIIFARDGHGEWLETIKLPLRDPDDRVMGVLGMAHDISARKAAEDRLQTILGLQTLLSRVNELLLKTQDLPSLFANICREAVNEGGFRLVWVGLANAEGLITPLVHAGVEEGYLASLRIDLNNPETGSGPTAMALRQQRPYICNDIAHAPEMAPWREEALRRGYRASAAFPLRLSGRIQGVINFYRDQVGFFQDHEVRILENLAQNLGFALETQEALHALRDSEERLRLALASAQQGFYDVDLTQGTVIVSPEYARMLGYSPEDFRESERDWYARIHPQDRERAWQNYQDYLAGRSTTYRQEFRLQMRDGGYKWILSTGKIVAWDEAGRPTRMLGTHTDIDAFKNLEASLRASEQNYRELNATLEKKVRERTAAVEAVNRELETFTYTVSHDLKAPLRAIDGYSRLLEEDCAALLSSEGRTFLANVRRGVAQMSQLIDDLLAYSRVERRTFTGEMLSLRPLVEHVLAEKQDEVARLRAEIVLNIPIDLQVRGDADGLLLVLRNLLDNALKFSQHAKPPHIHIAARQESDKVRIEVGDNGIGFDPRFSERIFAIFQRLQRAEDYPGTGIGLAIVRKAVQRMGGHVWGESQPGKGATFIVELPS